MNYWYTGLWCECRVPHNFFCFSVWKIWNACDVPTHMAYAVPYVEYFTFKWTESAFATLNAASANLTCWFHPCEFIRRSVNVQKPKLSVSAPVFPFNTNTHTHTGAHVTTTTANTDKRRHVYTVSACLLRLSLWWLKAFFFSLFTFGHSVEGLLQLLHITRTSQFIILSSASSLMQSETQNKCTFCVFCPSEYWIEKWLAQTRRPTGGDGVVSTVFHFFRSCFLSHDK